MKYEELPKYNTPQWLSLDNFDGELWKDIDGYEGIYQISNYGRIKSLERDITRCDGRTIHVSQRILKYKKARGYDCVGLSDSNNTKYFRVHRLVGFAFIPNPYNAPEMNHKDENPHNNMAENLEWCTSTYNSNYGNHNKKLSESKKRRFKEDIEFAKRMRSALLECRKKESWKIAQRESQRNNSNCKPVLQFSLDGKFLKQYRSANEASRQTGLYSQNIGQVCLGKIHQSGGFIWKYATK